MRCSLKSNQANKPAPTDHERRCENVVIGRCAAAWSKSVDAGGPRQSRSRWHRPSFECDSTPTLRSEPVIPYWNQSRWPRVLTLGHQLAKADENRGVRENKTGASGEVDLDNGGSDAVILDDPERARLSE